MTSLEDLKKKKGTSMQKEKIRLEDRGIQVEISQ